MKEQYNTYKNPFCWTEDNRLQAVKDDKMGAFYNYDASGERNLKLSGGTMDVTQNGYTMNVPVLDEQTLYASGLVTINEKGYTKHYFEEGKRICSNIGGGFRNSGYDIMAPVESITPPYVEQLNNAEDGIMQTFDACLNTPVNYSDLIDEISNVMKYHERDRNDREYPFYYTNDHLGSSTYITDESGAITQTLAYLPYGESWVSLDNQPPYLSPFKFNGKEKDEETGYNNYGARYYWDKGSFWLSVDPMSDKYPHVTNYVYCSNNPVMVIDPDGRDEWEVDMGLGTLKSVKPTDNDSFFLTKDGERTGKKKEFDYKVIAGSIANKTPDNSSPDYKSYTDVYIKEGTSNTDATGLFNFLADNTNVEWSKVNVTAYGKERISLHTSHTDSKEFRSSELLRDPSSFSHTPLTSYSHSHNRIGGHQTSEGDLFLKNMYKDLYPDADFFLRYKKANGNPCTRSYKYDDLRRNYDPMENFKR